MNKLFRLTILASTLLITAILCEFLIKGSRAQLRSAVMIDSQKQAVQQSSQDDAFYDFIVKADDSLNDEITVKIILRNKGKELFYIYERTAPKDFII